MKGWRTFLVQLVTGLVGLAVTLDWAPIIGDRHAGVFLIVLAMVNTGLRAVTTTPPGRSE
jgi:hypothetical protein